jgi:hypothetical protein
MHKKGFPMNKNKLMTMAALTAAAMAGSTQARADGFRCETTDGSLAVKVFNHTAPSAGTRSAAVLVLSDPAVSHGRKTIASFSDTKSTLSSRGASYVANVDLRTVEARRKGELISVGGQATKLGQLDEVRVDVDFSYANPVDAEDEVTGEITLVKRNGEKLYGDLECSRYLKN